MQTIARNVHLPQLGPCRLDQVTKGTCLLNVLSCIPSSSLLLCGTNVAEGCYPIITLGVVFVIVAARV